MVNAILQFISALPTLYKIWEDLSKTIERADREAYIRNSIEVYKRLKGAKTQKESLEAALLIQRLMHTGKL